MISHARFDDRLFAEPTTRARREVAARVMAAALAAADPAEAVRRAMRREGNALLVDDRRYDLDSYDRVLVVGCGKAGAPMAAAVEDVVGDRVTEGVVVVKYGHTAPTRIVKLIEAGHPIPDEAGEAGTRAVVDLAGSAGERDLVIVVISGGGSALMTLPVEPVSLHDLQSTTNLLLRAGATINELNTVRKHLDAVKGGGLARLCQPADALTLVLSDVVGNPLDVIASGPTVPDESTFAEAAHIVDRFELWGRLPRHVAERLRSGAAGVIPDTPKSGDPLFERTHTTVVASNTHAAEAAVEQARIEGLNALLLSTYVEGEAREVAKVVAAIAREERASARPLPLPCCVVMGGETTVTVRGEGLGGRNQELALAVAPRIVGLAGVIVASLATDGNDGPNDAAGALVDGTTAARASALGLDIDETLDNNDSYPFFQHLGDHLMTGPTNTNVNDLLFVFCW
jgi:hydroxypyruvate reductase